MGPAQARDGLRLAVDQDFRQCGWPVSAGR
jgi:hypothetical protein